MLLDRLIDVFPGGLSIVLLLDLRKLVTVVLLFHLVESCLFLDPVTVSSILAPSLPVVMLFYSADFFFIGITEIWHHVFVIRRDLIIFNFLFWCGIFIASVGIDDFELKSCDTFGGLRSSLSCHPPGTR